MFDSKRDLLAVGVLAVALYAAQWAETGQPPALPQVHMAQATWALNVQAHALVEHAHAWVLSLLPDLECQGAPASAPALPARCDLK
jgi:hypothetical protein